MENEIKTALLIFLIVGMIFGIGAFYFINKPMQENSKKIGGVIFLDYLQNPSPSQKKSENINNNKKTYLKYLPYTKRYEQIICYNSPPPNKLFYIKCP